MEHVFVVVVIVGVNNTITLMKFFKEIKITHKIIVQISFVITLLKISNIDLKLEIQTQ